MKIKNSVGNVIALRLIERILSARAVTDIGATLESIAGAKYSAGINGLADIYEFSGESPDSLFNVYIAAHKGKDENDIVKLECFDVWNILNAVNELCMQYNASDMGFTDVELRLKYLNGYEMEDIAKELDWKIDSEIRRNRRSIFVTRLKSTGEWVKCNEDEALYKIEL